MMSCSKSLGKSNFQKLVISVLESFKAKQIFTKFTDHIYDSEPLENHIHLLTKAVAEKYLHVRYDYAGKQLTAKLQSQVKVKSRQVQYIQNLFNLAATNTVYYTKVNVRHLFYVLL